MQADKDHVPRCDDPGCCWPRWRAGFCRRHWLLYVGDARSLSPRVQESIMDDAPPWERGLSTLHLRKPGRAVTSKPAGNAFMVLQ